MNRSDFLLCGLGALGSSLAGNASGQARQEEWRRRIRRRRAGADGKPGDGMAVKAPPPRTIAYGSHPLEQIDVWRAGAASGPAPRVMFVHGGGWKRGDKKTAGSQYAPVHFPQQGYVYASINYRLVPENTVEDQAGDVAQALRALLDNARPQGIDPRRVVLMGHSAGAHLVALAGTDGQYLRQAGLSFASVAGIIANDGAAYDVEKQIAQSGPVMRDTYLQAFGSDRARQRRLSPIHHAAAPNAPAFLLIHVQRRDGIAQAKALEGALRRAGTAVERHEFSGTGPEGHAEINRRLGDPAYPATAVVDAWLGRLFAR